MSEEKSTHEPSQWERIPPVLLILFVTLFLTCSGLITLLELPLHLAIGWAIHGWNNLPALLPLWPKLLLPLLCLALATWLVHRFIRWWLAVKGHAIDWHARHTVTATSLVLLGAAAAIALSGVVHQAAWLGDVPWWTTGTIIEKRNAEVHAYELVDALTKFRDEHGRYPDSLKDVSFSLNALRQSPESGAVPEPYVYLKPHDNAAKENDLVILVSPLLGSNHPCVIVGFASGDIHSLPAEALPGILETRRYPQARKP